MKDRLVAAMAILLFTSCNKTTDGDRPVCLLNTSYGYSTYWGSSNGLFPNAFTPNGDGKNDRFKPIYISTSSAFTLTVSDINNNILFQTSDPKTTGWDGRNSAGETAPAGRYAVKIASDDNYGANLCVALLKSGPSNCIPRSDDGSYYFEDMFDSSVTAFNKATREVICPQ